MTMDEEGILDLENFESVPQESKDLNLSLIDLGSGLFDQGNDMMTLSTQEFSHNEAFLRDSVQIIQDVVIHFQTKFKEYESFSEYAKCEFRESYQRNEWKNLNFSKIEAEMPILTESLRMTFQKSYDVMRSMDTAIVRIRSENEKLNEVLKEKEKERRKQDVSPEYRESENLDSKITNGGSVNIEAIVKSKLKKKDAMINELKSRIQDLEGELSTAEESAENLKKKNKSLKREIKDLNEKNESSVLDEISKLENQIKKLHKAIKPKADETELTEYVRSNSRDIESKIDNLIESTERRDEQHFEKIMDEIISVKDEIKDFKREKYPDFTGNDTSNLVENLRSQICELKEALKLKDEEIMSRNKDFELKDNRFQSLNPNSFGEENSSGKLKQLERLMIQKNDAFEKIREKLLASKLAGDSLRQEKEELLKNITILENKVEEFKLDNEKKTRAMSAMKDKIKELSTTSKSSEDAEVWKRKYDQSLVVISNHESIIASSKREICSKNEELEGLKKNNNHLEKEMANLKKLNFPGKQGNKQ